MPLFDGFLVILGIFLVFLFVYFLVSVVFQPIVFWLIATFGLQAVCLVGGIVSLLLLLVAMIFA